MELFTIEFQYYEKLTEYTVMTAYQFDYSNFLSSFCQDSLVATLVTSMILEQELRELGWQFWLGFGLHYYMSFWLVTCLYRPQKMKLNDNKILPIFNKDSSGQHIAGIDQ